MTNESGPSILVANRTGGQGKTVVAQLVALGYEFGGVSRRIFSADTSDDLAGAAASKLGRVLAGKVTELGIGASMSAIRDDVQIMMAHWDRLGEALVKGGALVDLGANVVPMVWDWARQRNARSTLLKAPPIWMVVPVTAQKQPLIDALDVLRDALDPESPLPVSRSFVVLNEVFGRFDHLEGSPEMRALMAMADKGVSFVPLARCRMGSWARMESDFVPFGEIMCMDLAVFRQRFGLSLFAASGDLDEFFKWLLAQLMAMRRVGLVPREDPDSIIRSAAGDVRSVA